MGRLQKILPILVSAMAVLGSAVGIALALKSPLFKLRDIQFVTNRDIPPISLSELEKKLGIRAGAHNLFFDVSLSQLDARIRTEPWVQDVILEKRFPTSLVIRLQFRTPIALFKRPSGSVGYVDETGAVFGRVSLKVSSDLPWVMGSNGALAEGPEQASRIRQLLDVLDRVRPLHPKLTVDGIEDTGSERGIRLLVSYPLHSGSESRAMIDLGLESPVSPEFSEQLTRLQLVLDYLIQNSTPARQIRADTGKKIVVKTARGS